MGSTPTDVSKSESEYEYKNTKNNQFRVLGRTPVDIYIYTELTRNAYSVRSHIQKIERVEADNQFVAEMADVDLDNHLLPDLVGGETLSLCLSGRVKRY